MKKTSVLYAATCLAVAASVMPASAHDSGAVAAGVLGGLAVGAIIGSAANNGPYYAGPQYYQPAPAYYGPACYWQRQRVWDGFGWRWSRVRVCN